MDYARFTGHTWCMGSNFIAETSAFKNYTFDPSLLTEDASWSIELLKDGMSLAVLPMALSYGQLPRGSAREKRRKRWDKGGMQMCFHILRNVPLSRFTWSAKCWAFYILMIYFIVFPSIIMLTLFGFRVVAHNCFMQTGSFFLDPDQTAAEMNGAYGVRTLAWMWNYIGAISFAAWILMVFAYMFNALRFWHRGQFLNARQGYKWFFLQFGYIVVDTLLMLFPLLSYKYQTTQFHSTEMLLDFVFCITPVWEPTPKVTVCNEKKFNGKDSLTLSASDEGLDEEDSSNSFTSSIVCV